ncbi:MAG: hypothetical protein ACE5EX_05320 [Phycisphaerae bacterium]
MTLHTNDAAPAVRREFSRIDTEYWLGRVRLLPEIREAKVAAARTKLHADVYEGTEVLEALVERLREVLPYR